MLWPTVRTELVIGFDRADRDFWCDSYDRETDIDGNEVWPEACQQDGKWFSYRPRQILQAEPLRQSTLAKRPDNFVPWLASNLAERLNAASRGPNASIT